MTTNEKAPKRQAAKRSTHNRTVGACPGCGADVTAEVDVATFLGDVTMDAAGAPQVSVTNEVTSVRVVHRCDAKPGAVLEPEMPTTPPPAKKAATKKAAATRPGDDAS